MKTKETGACQAELPAIWVGDLGDYNAGILTGEWIVIEADTTVEEIHERIATILSQGVSEDSPHEEWLICDYNNLPLSGPYTSLETVVAIARLVHEYDYAVVEAYLDHFGAEAIDELEERYCGLFESVEDYAYELINDCYDLQKLMGDLASYFDYASFARDLELGSDITSAYVGAGQVVIFRNY
jgi:antirestriction protein